jgi:hypothetical protein
MQLACFEFLCWNIWGSMGNPSQITQFSIFSCQCSEEDPHYSSTSTSTAIKDWLLRAARYTDEWSESSQCVSAWGGTGLQQVVKWGDALLRPLRWEHTAHKSRIILYTHLVYVHPSVSKWATCTQLHWTKIFWRRWGGCPAGQDILHILRTPKINCWVHKSPPVDTILSQINSIHISDLI